MSQEVEKLNATQEVIDILNAACQHPEVIQEEIDREIIESLREVKIKFDINGGDEKCVAMVPQPRK